MNLAQLLRRPFLWVALYTSDRNRMGRQPSGAASAHGNTPAAYLEQPRSAEAQPRHLCSAHLLPRLAAAWNGPMINKSEFTVLKVGRGAACMRNWWPPPPPRAPPPAAGRRAR